MEFKDRAIPLREGDRHVHQTELRLDGIRVSDAIEAVKRILAKRSRDGICKAVAITDSFNGCIDNKNMYESHRDR